MTHILYAASAAGYGFNTRSEKARGTREELRALKDELDAADEARGHYSTVRWIEKI